MGVCVRTSKRLHVGWGPLIFPFIVLMSKLIQTVGDNVTDPLCYPSHKDVEVKSDWVVGVLAIRGSEAAYNEFNSTFNDYLSATAGARFDKPLSFTMKPLNFLTLFTDVEDKQIDFLYVNPSAFSCIESEYHARSLVSQVSRRKIGENNYELKRFGGVIMTRSDRDDINSLTDIRGKIVAAASISGLGSGQMQFREMQEAGMNYLNDPKQIVFTSNQGKVVNGVLNGDFDVGFVRTDQIERTKDADGVLVDPELFKVISQKEAEIDGAPFPFKTSTRLYPEWNLGALSHVPDLVATEVQTAMLAIEEHALVGVAQETYDVTVTQERRRCDTTDPVAAVAVRAAEEGKYAGWTPTQSYMELRNMQEATEFIRYEDDNVWRCVRSTTLYDAIRCPEGWKRTSEAEFDAACAAINLDCEEGFQCVCNPCYEDTECIESVKIGGRCVGYEVLLPSIIVPILVIGITAFLLMVSYKSRQMVRQAEAAAKNERDLNEFIAHEVRNPLSAAISASVFVNSAVQAEINEDTRDALQEDAGIISSSLKFINDLLRSMLDVQRATKNQMTLDQDDVDIQYDIFEPVASMIYNRDTNWTVLIKCPEGLVVKSDKLRLQQVVLNLARNSAKFVHEGFVRLRADVIDNSVHLFIEDSGPGIPEEKKNNLFSRYQESLDSLAQGTGVGLSLCLKLVTLMEGTIELDDTYRSGHKDLPGACIDIDLNQEPQLEEGAQIFEWDAKTIRNPRNRNLKINKIIYDERDSGLPRNISVLFVDDDRNLRKLAMRALRNVCPNWYIREAASGETALAICENDFFDIIFMDQYMTSVEQCLKGTETTRALRSKGAKSIICGLSANNLESNFLAAGANFFQMKPFPVDNDDLNGLLKRLVIERANLKPMDEEPTLPETMPESFLVETTLKDDVSELGDTVSKSTKFSGSREVDLRSNGGNPLQSSVSILFVDDDRILRRLAIRAIKKMMPNCFTRETDSGESAIRLCQAERFDFIFIDQHMTSTTASIEKMSGSETVRAMRKQNVASVITGLSANSSTSAQFLAAGADNFQLKPFPAAAEELKPLMLKLLGILGGQNVAEDMNGSDFHSNSAV